MQGPNFGGPISMESKAERQLFAARAQLERQLCQPPIVEQF